MQLFVWLCVGSNASFGFDFEKEMSKKRRTKQQQQQQSRDDSQIQPPKAIELKLESKQPTNIEFQHPGLLDFSILTPKQFKVIGKTGNKSVEFRFPIGITQQRTTGRYFISEYNNNRIQVLNENFTHRMFVGQEASEPGDFHGLSPWAVSEEGRLVV